MSATSDLETALRTAQALLHAAQRVAVLTGAGVSAQSGIPTFRDAQIGLWARYSPEELASPDAYVRDPMLVWRWYFWRLGVCLDAQPNAGHTALARLEAMKATTLVTQNVDGLHARAGSRGVVELHGNITQGRCERCGQLRPLEPSELLPPHCAHCGARLRPNVVWFGETLPRRALERAWTAFQTCEVALIVGTSGLVQPAASLAGVAAQAGARVIEVNPDATPISSLAAVTLRGASAVVLPRLLEVENAPNP
jgi:NAD-dependent deacetylase